MNEQSIFLESLEIESDGARRDFLRESCPDTAMRSRIERLLLVQQKVGGFMEEPAASDAAADVFGSDLPFEEVGASIGPYKLLEQIGEGGMGVVYMAAQQTPVKRKVAIKVIKPGMDTKQVIARFEAERQALALMDHPNIARVVDAGATESGRPYFVMELVRGIPLTDYCQREALGLEQRLALFVDVCHAVQHAHLRGIIHRDIKPSNVMVTLHDGISVVKMIDFCVAKAMNQQLTEKTLFTNYSQMIGTPLYMSPEQAEMSGLDVDTRSDIYSLGVLLYEILTETTPFEQQRLKEAGYDEMRRIIREEEPPRASTRVSTLQNQSQTLSDQRRTNLAQLGRALRSELDWIVVKALEKNRNRRYQSAREFADDVKRYQQGQPVEAFPPSALYQLQKIIRRNRALVASLTMAFLLMVAATAVSSVFALRAHRAEEVAESALLRAETKGDIAAAISSFLSDELLGQASPYVSAERDLQLREVLDHAAERINGHFDGRPLVEAQIPMTIGTTYRHLGESEKPAQHLQHAMELRREELGESHRDSLKSAHELAIARLYGTGRKAAIPLWEQTVERQRRVLGDDDPDTLRSICWLAACPGRGLLAWPLGLENSKLSNARHIDHVCE